MKLAEALRARIEVGGPMPFEEFMAACLYDSDAGFFTSGPVRSVQEGDFLTSPEISPWFGRMLARFVRTERSFAEPPYRVVEVGAGSGSLIRPLSEDLCGEGYDYHAVEASPAARDALTDLLGEWHVHASLDAFPQRFDGVIIAN